MTQSGRKRLRKNEASHYVSYGIPMQHLERYQICVLITAVMMWVIPQKNVIDISIDKIPGLGVQKLVSQSGLGCDYTHWLAWRAVCKA
jgi:hypothetical protein